MASIDLFRITPHGSTSYAISRPVLGKPGEILRGREKYEKFRIATAIELGMLTAVISPLSALIRVQDKQRALGRR
jgi:hypothetical protein